MTPRHWSYVHFTLCVFWLVMIPVALITGLRDSVSFLVFISLLALVFSEAASWQASRAERRMDPNDPYGN